MAAARSVVVVGGGICGLSLAVCLVRAGIDVEVLLTAPERAGPNRRLCGRWPLTTHGVADSNA